MDFFGIDLTRVPQYSLAAENRAAPAVRDRDHVPVHPHQHEGLRPADAGQHEADHVYDAADVRVLLLYLPAAFSLYYVISNIVMTVQTQVMRKIYDPEKMRKEVEAEIAPQAQGAEARCKEHHHQGHGSQDRRGRGKKYLRQRNEQAPPGVCPQAG